MPRLATVASAMDTTTVRCLASRHLLNSSGGTNRNPRITAQLLLLHPSFFLFEKTIHHYRKYNC
jgi:hypothetical protein